MVDQGSQDGKSNYKNHNQPMERHGMFWNMLYSTYESEM